MKSAVYSWRLSPDRKAELEDEARRDGKTIAGLLEEITADWLRQRRNGRRNDDAEQEALRKRVMATVGTIRGGDPTRAERARELVREIILQKHLKEVNASRRTD